jgi:hypothetical protein
LVFRFCCSHNRLKEVTDAAKEGDVLVLLEDSASPFKLNFNQTSY